MTWSLSTQNDQRPCGVEDWQQRMLFIVLAVIAVTGSVQLWCLHKLESTPAKNQDAILQVLTEWDRKLHPARVNVRGSSLTLLLMLAMLVLMAYATTEGGQLHEILEIGFAVAFLLLALWLAMVHILWQPGKLPLLTFALFICCIREINDLANKKRSHCAFA